MSVIMSNSMSSAASDCMTQAVMRTLGYGMPAGKDDAPLEAGKAAHAAVELWMLGKNVDECMARFQELYKPFSDKFVASDDRLYYDNLAKIMNYFFSQCTLNSMPFEVEEAWIEKQIVAEVLPGVKVSDKSDGIVRMKDTGQRLSFELKTTSRIDDSWLSKFALDGQISAHTEVLRRNGFAVDGVLLFAIQFNKLPVPQFNKNGSEKKCRTHGLAVSACWGHHVKWEKFILQRGPEDIDDWIDALLPVAEEYERSLQRVVGLTPPEGISDLSQNGMLHGSCPRCTFRDFCLGHRRQLGNLVMREQDPNIIHSGLES